MSFLIRYELAASLELLLAAVLVASLLWSKSAGFLELPILAVDSKVFTAVLASGLSLAVLFPLACFFFFRCETPLRFAEREYDRTEAADSYVDRMRATNAAARVVGLVCRAAFACSLVGMLGCVAASLSLFFCLKRLFIMGCLRYRGWHHFFTDCIICTVLMPVSILVLPELPIQVYVVGGFLPVLFSAKDSWELAIVERYLRHTPAQDLLEPHHLLFNVQITVIAASTAVCWVVRDRLDKRRGAKDSPTKGKQPAASTKYLDGTILNKRD